MELAEAYRQFAATEMGGLIVADLNARFGGNPFVADNPHSTSYRCGGLAVVEYIIQNMAAQPADRQEKA